MPVIPEKRQLDSRLQGALGTQFWAQPVQSARNVVGATCTVPCEPPPLPLCTPSGLSRTQLLVASHAAGLPLFPGWCEEHGGVVLDRVLFQSGRPRWWAALSGRLKAQRMVAQRHTHTLRESLSDPDNYALSANGRLLLSHATTLRASLQADTLQQIPASFRGWRGSKGRRRANAASSASLGGAAASTTSSGGEVMRGMSAALQLKQQLLDGYELTADLAVNEPSLDGVRRAVNTPLRLSVDVGPRPTQRLGPLLYRVGVHGVLAPASAEGSSGAHVLAAHAQGALAVVGHRTLWQAPSKPWQHKPQQDKPAATTIASATQQKQAASSMAAPTSSDKQPDSTTKSSSGRKGSSVSDGDEEGSGATATRRHASRPRRYTAKKGSGSNQDINLVTPGQVQDGLQQTTWRLERLRTDLQSWTGRVRSGELQRGEGSKAGAGRGRNSWSCVLPAPHLRVGGLVGVLGRVPLHHTHFADGDSASGPLGQGDSSDSLGFMAAGRSSRSGGGARAAAAAPEPPGSTSWLRQVASASRHCMEQVVMGSLGGLSSLGSHLAHDVGLRLFAGGGASLQVGQMRRNLLDFSRLEATLDLGLTAPKVGGGGASGSSSGGHQQAMPRGQRHPAFSLDEAGAWHSLTLSATQQLVGPVRLRADWRLALDSAVPLIRDHSGSGIGSRGSRGGGVGGGSSRVLGLVPGAAGQLARHVGGMRPSLLDAAYGIDVVVPGSGGLVRGVAWFSPRRGEGAIELRLL